MALVYDPVTGRMVETNSATTPQGVGLPGGRGTAAPPVGIGLTPEQQTAQRRTQQQRAMADQLTQTRQTAGRVVDQVGGVLGDAYGAVLNAATVVPQTAYGLATGEIPVTFDDRLPGQDTRDRIRADLQSAQNARWAENNPQAAEQARDFGLGVSQRTVAQGLQPPGGYPGINAPMATPVTTQAPTTNPDSLPPNATEADRIAAITAAAQQPAALDVAGLNRDLAETITASRPEAPIYQPQERGNYNMYNTDQGALAARAAPTAGINFGFGVGGAPTAGEYLATMQARDAQEARDAQQRRAAAQAALERSRYAQQMTSNNPFERRAARELLQGLDQREGLGITEAGATGRQQMQGDASRDVAGIQGQFGVTQAGVQAQGGVEQQRIASEQRAQQAAAMLAQDQAQFEMDPSNRRGAIIAQLAQAMLQAGDTQGAVSALYGTQPAAPARPDIKMVQGPTGETIGVTVNGVLQPFTQEEIAALAQAHQAYRVPVQ